MVLVPRIPEAERREAVDGLTIERFPYFFRRWEDIADGAVLENVRARRSRMLQLPFLLVGQMFATWRAVRRFRPDALHLHWIIPQGIAALVAARRVPWLVTSPGVDVYAFDGRLGRWLKRAVVRRAARVTTMNQDMRQRLVAIGAPPDKVVVLPFGADLTRVRRQVDGVHPVQARMLFAGRLVEKKGLGILLTALGKIPPGTPWTLDVVGDGPLAGALREQAAPFGDSVVFHGQVTPDELAARYAECEVLVVPSVPASTGDQDGLPVVLLEALAAGRAIVASRLPGIDEAIVDGEHGLLVEPGDAVALADAISSLMDSSELRRRLAGAARSRAEQYSVDEIGRAYVELLHEVLAEQAGGSRAGEVVGQTRLHPR